MSLGQVDYGKEITIALNPNANYEIKSLTINGVDVTAQIVGNSYTVAVYEDIVIACEFALVKHNVTIIESENGTIEVSGLVDNKAEYGSKVTITVTPNTNFKIATFTINGDVKSLNNNNQYVLTINGDTVIACTYVSLIEYSVIDETQAHYGTIYWKAGTKYSSTIPAGETVIFTLQPSGAYEIAKVLVNGEEVEVIDNAFIVENVQSNLTINVIYALPKYTVEYNAPTNGTFSIEGIGQDGKVEHGQSITITAIPNAGYKVKTLLVNTFNYATGNTDELLVNPTIISDTQIYCEFELIEYAVITETVANGTLSVSGVGENGKVLPGSQITISVTANPGYRVDKLLINGKEQSATENYVYTVNEDITISAEISFVRYSVTSVCSSEFGVVSIDNETPSYFDTVTIRFIPLNDNCTLVSATVNGNVVSVINNVLTLSGITEDMVIDAVFDFTKTTFTGSVEYEDGTKARGVKVLVGSSYATTNTNGEYSIVLPKGTHTFSANEYGWTAIAKGEESLTVTSTSYAQQGPTIVLVNNNPVNANDPVMAKVELETTEGATLYYNKADACVGNSVTFTITPASARAIEKVKVNGTEYTPVYTVEKDYEVTCAINSENVVVEPIFYAQGQEPTQVALSDGWGGEHNYDASLYYRNDGEINGADPGVMYVEAENDPTGYGGGFYMATTDRSVGTNGTGVFPLYRSKDLSSWELVGAVNGKAMSYSGNWTDSEYWAPELFQETVDKLSGGTKTRFYLYFAAKSMQGDSTTEYTSNTSDNNNFYLSIAVSDSPVGPYTIVDTSTYYKWYSDTVDYAKSTRTTDLNDNELTAYTPTFNFYRYNTELRKAVNNSIGKGNNDTIYPEGYWPAIDVSPFIDPATGDMYCYFTQHSSTKHEGNTNWVVKMKDYITPDYDTMHIVTISGYTVTSDNLKVYINTRDDNKVLTDVSGYSGNIERFEYDGSPLGNNVSEAPNAIAYQDPTTGQWLYYLTYSPMGYSFRQYSVLQAVSTSPNGPFRKLNPNEGLSVIGMIGNLEQKYYGSWYNKKYYDISAPDIDYSITGKDSSGSFTKDYNDLSTAIDYAGGTGHHSFVQVNGEIYSVYHEDANGVSNYDHYNDDVDGYQGRRIAFDKVHIVKSPVLTYNTLDSASGSSALPVLYGNGPTASLQPKPSVATGYTNIANEATITGNGTGIDYLKDDLHVTHSVYGDWEYKTSGTDTITMTFETPKNIRSVMIYNSAYYNYALKSVRKLTLTLASGEKVEFNNLTQNDFNYNSAKSMMRYGGSIIADFNEVSVTKIEITVNPADKLNTSSQEIRIGDIKVLGRVSGKATDFEFRSSSDTAPSNVVIDGKATAKEWEGQNYFYFDNGNFNGKLTSRTEKDGIAITATVYDKHIYHGSPAGSNKTGENKGLEGEAFWFKNTYLRIYAHTGGKIVNVRFSAFEVDATAKDGNVNMVDRNINGDVTVDGEVNSGNTKSMTVEAFIPYSTMGLSNPSENQTVKLLLEYARPMDKDARNENINGASGTQAITTPKIIIGQNGCNKATDCWQYDEYITVGANGYVAPYNATIGAGAQGGAVVGKWAYNSSSSVTASSTAESIVYFTNANDNNFVSQTNITTGGGLAGYVIKKGNNKRAYLLDTSYLNNGKLTKTVIYSYENGIKEEIYNYTESSYTSNTTFKVIKNNEKIYFFVNNKFVYAEANNKYAGNTEVGLYSSGGATSFANASYNSSMSSVIDGLKTAYNISAIVPTTLNTIVGYKNTDKLYVFVSAIANTVGYVPSAVSINGTNVGATFSVPTGKQSMYYETEYTAGKAACVEVTASTVSASNTYSGDLRKASGFYPATSEGSQITFYADAVTLRFVSSSYVYEVIADKTYSVKLPSGTYALTAISADGGYYSTTSFSSGKITLSKQ